MLSICIPVYNFNISLLINSLTEQVKKLTVPCEIICIDDASENEYRTVNREAAEEVTYIRLANNTGRAGIRNLFLNYAKHDYLLFLDCDSLIINDRFLTDYIQSISNNSYDVICGGRIYDTIPPERKYRLRWLYGIKRESVPADKRNQHPNASFMTNNFAILKNLFLQIKFDERIKGYGHEDTLFGYVLQKNHIRIHHIQNPVLNGHIESNEEYLAKTKQAVISLTHIMQYTNGDEAFAGGVSLLRFYNKLNGFAGIVRFLFPLMCPFIEWLLKNGYVYLPMFDFYKLGILTKHINKPGK